MSKRGSVKRLKEARIKRSPSTKRNPSGTQIDLRRKKVFVLWIHDIKKAEIARMLGVSIKTVDRDVEALRKEIDQGSKQLEELKIKSLECVKESVREYKRTLDREKRTLLRLDILDRISNLSFKVWSKLEPSQHLVGVAVAPAKQPMDKDAFATLKEEMKKRAPTSSGK